MPALKLYVASSGGNQPTKIGISKNPRKRMLTLYPQGSRRPLLEHVEHLPPEVNACDVERLAHGLLRLHQDKYATEWFSISAEEAVKAVKLAVEMAKSRDCKVPWNIRINITPTAKAALKKIAEDDEVEPEDVISGILCDYIVARSTS